MSVIFLDETRKRSLQLSEELSKSKQAITFCTTSNEFLTRLTTAAPQRVFLDVESWNKGRIIYSYLAISQKLADVPVVFYNAPENFSTIDGRPKHSKDEVLVAPTPVETIVELANRVL